MTQEARDASHGSDARGEGIQGFKRGARVPCARTLSRRPALGGLSRCAGEAIRPLPRPRNGSLCVGARVPLKTCERISGKR
jgi:hypothetical protein